MSGWLKRHWRDVAIVALFLVIALKWDEAVMDAYRDGLVARCRWLPW
jgi:hypothetical protein